ncbi:MAG: DUF1295 domain-containing protein [Flavicella sp.]
MQLDTITILFSQAALIVLGMVSMLWIVSVFIKNVSIVDIFWGIGFVLVNAFYIQKSGVLNPRKIILFALVSIWGLRLASYLAMRNLGKGEDFRYREFRKKFGPKRYWWFSYFQTFLLQGALIMVISLPLLGISTSISDGNLNLLDFIGIGVWVIGFVFEAGGDFQLARFKKIPENKGKVLDTGFWKYTRHPNYFGDAMIWWAYAIFCCAAGNYIYVLGSIVMTLLLLYVSGIRLLEKTLQETKPEYKVYMQQTNAFFPWFPKV